MNDANASLRIITEQAGRLEAARRSRTFSTRPSREFADGRKYAKSLYNGMIRGSCWNCECRDQHLIYFRLDATKPGNRFDTHCHEHPSTPLKFTLMIESDGPNALPRNLPCRKAIEVETSRAKLLNSTPISNLCATLMVMDSSDPRNGPIGFIADDTDPTYRHNIYLVSTASQDQDFKPLTDLLTATLNSSSPRPRQNTFTRKDRLHVALTLALSVLQFHGSWLKLNWRTQDILFWGQNTGQLLSPWLSLRLSECVVSTTTAKGDLQTQVLFPLGLALIELSLCQAVADLQSPYHGESDAMTSLATTSAYIHQVYDESGVKYGEVVQRCLFGVETFHAEDDDNEFQEIMMSSVIMPLMEVLRAFTNPLPIY